MFHSSGEKVCRDRENVKEIDYMANKDILNKDWKTTIIKRHFRDMVIPATVMITGTNDLIVPAGHMPTK